MLDASGADGGDVLRYAGVGVVRAAADAAVVAACRRCAAELYAEAVARAASDGGDVADAARGFHYADVSQRGPHRVDLRLDEALSEAPFDAIDDARWRHLVDAALGPGALLRRRALVVAAPGAADQAFHADAPLAAR